MMMKSLGLVWFLIGVASVVSTGEYLYKGDSEAKAVIEHTDQTDFETSTKPRLVEFYSPYCGGCRNFKPQYITIAEDLKSKYDNVEVYAVSCAPHKALCQKHNIGGYPSLYAFPVGASQGIYLQKSKMGGMYSVSAIAKVLKLDEANDDPENDAAADSTMTSKNSLLLKNSPHGTKENQRQLIDEVADEKTEDRKDEKEDGKEDGADEKEDGADDGEAKEEGSVVANNEEKKEENKEEEDKAEEEEDKAEEDEKDSEKDDEKSEGKDDEEDIDEGDEPASNSVLSGARLTQSDSISKEEALSGSNKKDDEDGGAKESDEDQTDEEADEKEDNVDDKIGSTPLSVAKPIVVPFRPGQVPGAGALKAQLKMRDMDKWKNAIALRKQMLESKKGGFLRLRPQSQAVTPRQKGPGGKVQLNTPGAVGPTKVMNANKPGTPEFEKRKLEILAKIKKTKAGGRFGKLFSKVNVTTTLPNKAQLPFLKDVAKRGMLSRGIENLPGLKRIVRLSPEEELILDASLSFMTGLKHGVYMSTGALDNKKKDALKSWLELLSISLPPEWGLHALIDDLLANMELISKAQANLQTILEKHKPPRQQWSKSCAHVMGGGFSCGMWKLFHIITVGIAEHHGGMNLINAGLIEPSSRIFAPSDAADVIRDYMANFFGCDDCREHFVSQYNACGFRRCERLTDDVDNASDDDWKQLALWMWEVHNDVNIRVSNKRLDRLQKSLSAKHLQGAQSLKVQQSQESEIKVLWPSLESCLVCFDDSGKWNEDSVFEYLERTYWDSPDAKFDRLLKTRKVDDGQDPTGGGLVWFMLFIAVAVFLGLRQKIISSSFHSTIQLPSIPTSVRGVGNKLGDVVAGKSEGKKN